MITRHSINCEAVIHDISGRNKCKEYEEELQKEIALGIGPREDFIVLTVLDKVVSARLWEWQHVTGKYEDH